MLNKRFLLASVCLLFVCVASAKTSTNFKDWAKTPPMGWNSWDCYGPTVVESEVKANADYMAKNLKKYGWEYVVVDIRWNIENDKAGGYNQTDPIYTLDKYGRYTPATNRFPSAIGGQGFKPLADYIHKKGLKFGIHIMRGVPKVAVNGKMPILGANGITADQIHTTQNQCAWLRDNYTVVADKPGAQEYYNSIFNLYASWGVDFVKVDDLSAPRYNEGEVTLIRKAIDQCGRAIVLSTSPGETPLSAGSHVSQNVNMWRMVNDVWDSWRDVTHLLNVAQRWYTYIAPGTWPDCDMIPLGRLSVRGERGKDRMTNLKKEEQYSLMTLFTIFRSPLMYGGDLPSMDPFTLSLLTNKDVLRMHRESSNVRQLFQEEGRVAITSINPKTKEVYLAVFNTGQTQQSVKVDLAQYQLPTHATVKDMWSGENRGTTSGVFEQTLEPHACGLFVMKSI